jgi:hypothetical protein
MWCGGTICFQKKQMETLDHRLQTGDQSVTKVTTGVSAQGEEKDDALRCTRPSVQTSSSESDVYGLMSKVSLEDLALHNPIATSTVLVKREVLLAAGGFDEQFRGPEDYDLWLRVASLPPSAARREKCCPVAESLIKSPEDTLSLTTEELNNLTTIPPVATQQPNNLRTLPGAAAIMRMDTPLSLYRQTPGSLSLDERKFLPQVLRVLDKAWAGGGALHGTKGYRRARGYQYLSCAWMAAERGELGRAIVMLLTAVCYWPRPFRGACQNIPWAHAKVAWRILRHAKSRGRLAIAKGFMGVT